MNGQSNTEKSLTQHAYSMRQPEHTKALFLITHHEAHLIKESVYFDESIFSIVTIIKLET